MRVQGFSKGKLSSQRCIVTIKLFLSYASVVHPEADALVADELSCSNRLIDSTVLSCLPLSLEL